MRVILLYLSESQFAVVKPDFVHRAVEILDSISAAYLTNVGWGFYIDCHGTMGRISNLITIDK